MLLTDAMSTRGTPVHFDSRVVEGITREVLAASDAEVGGLLLGSRTDGGIRIDDFEPVLCEHAFGPFFVLTAEEVQGFEESLEWFRGQQAGGLEVLGFYRSQQRPDFAPDDRDREIMRRYFPQAEALLLLLKPSGTEIEAEFFSPAPQRQRHETRPSSARVILPPPSRPRQLETDEPERRPISRIRLWAAAVLLLSAIAAVIGYRTAGRPPEAGQSTVLPGSPQSLKPIPVASGSKGSPASAAPAVSMEINQGIRAALDRWQRALRSGDPDLIAQSYAPQLERYFDQRDTSSAEVRRSAARFVARYGRPAILRVSEVNIESVSEDRVVTTFRKHWQTSGSRVYAGEEQERLSFVRLQDAWKIASEQETKVYWTQRPR